jgi:hypothetical protein
MRNECEFNEYSIYSVYYLLYSIESFMIDDRQHPIQPISLKLLMVFHLIIHI